MPRHPAMVIACAVVLAIASACEAGRPSATSPIVAGSSSAPRAVNVILKDWLFLPDPIDVVPGETVVLRIVNGGLEIHELVIGDQAVQDAWEAAEAAAANPPPGPTPVVTVDPARAGLRAVVPSGERVDVTWTVPATTSAAAATLFGCHIPGHWARGMRAGLRSTAPSG